MTALFTKLYYYFQASVTRRILSDSFALFQNLWIYAGAKLIGINPDDVDHICLSAKAGFGTNDPQNIRVAGRSIDALKKRLRKQKDDSRLIFGRGNREWFVSSAFPIAGVSDPINHACIPGETDAEPQAGKNGWSEPVYFFDDRIDLWSYFNGYPAG